MPTTQLALDILKNAFNAHVTVNGIVAILDALAQPSVEDRDLASPPGSPAQGDRYLIATSPTGAWSGKAGYFTVYLDGAWKFVQPKEGWTLWVNDENIGIRFDGSTWGTVEAGSVDVSTVTNYSGATPEIAVSLAFGTVQAKFNGAVTGTATIANPTGTAVNQREYAVRIDNQSGGAVTIGFGTSYVICSDALSTSTFSLPDGKACYIVFRYAANRTGGAQYEVVGVVKE